MGVLPPVLEDGNVLNECTPFANAVSRFPVVPEAVARAAASDLCLRERETTPASVMVTAAFTTNARAPRSPLFVDRAASHNPARDT